MNRNTTILIVVMVLLVGLAAVIFFTSKASDTRKVNWYENYDGINKDPYGLSLVKTLLNNYNPEADLTPSGNDGPADYLNDIEGTDNSYVLIGLQYYLGEEDAEAVLDFVHRGNSAFVSTHQIPYDILYEVFGECHYYDGIYTSSNECINVDFYHPNLEARNYHDFCFRQHEDTSFRNWAYFDEDFCEFADSIDQIGYFDDFFVNFMRIKYGDGQFLLHTSPILFTNYAMLDDDGISYAEKVFSHLPEGNIYWDQRSKVPYYDDKQDDTYGGNQADANTQLSFILGQPTLYWAMLVFIISCFLYVIFRAKRRQKIIPVIEENTNTSLEFIETIGRLYFQQNDHKHLAHHKMKLWLGYLRNRYRVPTKVINDDLVKLIHLKSQVEMDKIENIFKQYKYINSKESIMPETLISFHKAIDHFYKNSK